MADSSPLVSVASGTEAGTLELADGTIVEVGSSLWYSWLRRNDSFRFESGFAGDDSFTARKHHRDRSDFWYAYRKMEGKLRNAYLGKSDSLSTDRLLAVAQKLALPPENKSKSYAQECITPAEQVAALEEKVGLLEQELAALRQVSVSRDRLVGLGDRYLAGLRMGRQAPKYKHGKAALDWLIEQLDRS